MYRLALQLGIGEVERWKETVSLDQIQRWLAFYQVSPWGDEWRRTARLAGVVATALGAKLKEDSEDMFLPTFDPGRAKKTDDEMMAEFMKIPGVVFKPKTKA